MYIIAVDVAFEVSASPHEHVTVARGIDDRLGANRHTALFCLKNGADRLSVLDQRCRHPAVKQQLNIGTEHHLQ